MAMPCLIKIECYVQDNWPKHADNHSGKQTCLAQTMVTEMAATNMFCTDTGKCSGSKVCSAQTLVNAMAGGQTFRIHIGISVTFTNLGQILVKAIHTTNTMALLLEQ